VYRRCLRLLKDHEAARDATQEVFMKLVRDMLRVSRRTVARKLERFLENARKYITRSDA